MSFPVIVQRISGPTARAPVAAPASRPVVVERASLTRLPWWPALLVWGLSTACSGALALYLHATLRTGMDLAIFDQGIRALSHGGAPVSAIKGGMSLWGDHFHPAIVVLVPLYWIRDDPRMLLLAQAVVVGAACAVLTRYAQQVLPARHRDRTATLVGLCLAGSVGVQGTVSFDFHEVCLAAVPVALSATALARRRWTPAIGWALAVLPVKEDMGLVVLGVALVLVVRRQARRAIAPMMLALCWTAAVVKLVIPGIAGHGWTYGATVSGGVTTLLGNLGASLTRIDGIGVTSFVLLLATGLLALRSPVALAALPMLLARGATSGSHLPMLGYHYDLLPQIFLFAAAVQVLGRLRPLALRVAVRRLVLLTLLLFLVGPCMWRLVAGALMEDRPGQAARALGELPAGAVVAVDPALASHASPHHKQLRLLEPATAPDGSTGWVVLDLRRHILQGAEPGQPRVTVLEGVGYRLVARHGDFVVLRR